MRTPCCVVSWSLVGGVASVKVPSRIFLSTRRCNWRVLHYRMPEVGPLFQQHAASPLVFLVATLFACFSPSPLRLFKLEDRDASRKVGRTLATCIYFMFCVFYLFRQSDVNKPESLECCSFFFFKGINIIIVIADRVVNIKD